MYLQLAESRTPSIPSQEISNPFIFIPDTSGNSQGLYVREDYFDSLSNEDFNKMMRKLAPFQPEVQSGTMSEGKFLSSRASRKEKREKKDSDKQNKKTEKEAKKRENKERRAETIKNLVSTVGGVASSIFGKKGGGETEDLGPTSPDLPEEKKSLLSNPLVWIAGIGLIGGGIYFATRKKSA